MSRCNVHRYHYCSLGDKLYRATPITPVEVSDNNGKTWSVLPPSLPGAKIDVPKYEPEPLGVIQWTNYQNPTHWNVEP